MNELLDLNAKFENEGLTEAESIRFAALLFYTGLVYSTGTFGRFCNDMIEAGHTDAMATELASLRANPLHVLGVPE